MLPQNLCYPKTLDNSLSVAPFLSPPSLTKFATPLRESRISIRFSRPKSKPFSVRSFFGHENDPTDRRDLRAFAGRSKKNEGGSSSSRIDGLAELRRRARRNALRKSQRLAENLFYRLKNPHGPANYADNFTEDELQMIGLGYDRMVRFMEKDDPNLKHPYDWYKYGKFGPYSWRGVVLGEPVRGLFSDERVTLIGDVRDQEEWEKIEQFEMVRDFQERLDSMNKDVGFRNFWVFIRHPRWRVGDPPWEQWTLVSEVVLEAGKQRLDKWNLMGRLGNNSRADVTKCAAWMRPDIIYVKRPVYQCRFEPQDNFFKAMMPLLDPETEQNFLFELENDNGEVELCTYFGGLCRMVKVNPKAFVDDVVKAFLKLSDEKQSKCLGFLLNNHPIQLLHPYTKEWKAKLEEMELGCDAPDEDDEDNVGQNKGDNVEIMDWIEDEEDDGNDDDDEDEDDLVLDGEDEVEDEELGIKEEDDSGTIHDEKYWDNEFKKAMSSNEGMENIARRSVEMSTRYYERQAREMEEKGKRVSGEKEEKGERVVSKEEDGGDELAMRRSRAKVSRREWKIVGYGPGLKKIKKSRIPPGLFLKAAVRPFKYKNLVKEIVLTRHAILEGEIGGKK